MLPFERASKKTWLGHIFVRNWWPNQKCTFWAGLPSPPQVQFYDSCPTGDTEPTPNKVFLYADSIFNVFIWIWRRQSSELTPIGTGKQSDDFAKSPFSLGNVAIRKSVKKTWLGHIFVWNWRPNQKCTFWAGLPSPPQVQLYDSGPTGGTEPTPNKVFLHAYSIFNVFIWI